jgi:hypothetical protein
MMSWILARIYIQYLYIYDALMTSFKSHVNLKKSPLSSISLGEGRLNGNVTVVSALASGADGMCDFIGGFGTASLDRASSSKNCKNQYSHINM